MPAGRRLVDRIRMNHRATSLTNAGGAPYGGSCLARSVPVQSEHRGHRAIAGIARRPCRSRAGIRGPVVIRFIRTPIITSSLPGATSIALGQATCVLKTRDPLRPRASNVAKPDRPRRTNRLKPSLSAASGASFAAGRKRATGRQDNTGDCKTR